MGHSGVFSFAICTIMSFQYSFSTKLSVFSLRRWILSAGTVLLKGAGSDCLVGTGGGDGGVTLLVRHRVAVSADVSLSSG